MTKTQPIGFMQKVKAYFASKQKLKMRIAWLEFELEMYERKTEDADNRLEAYKDILAALSRHHQLSGLLNQIDIDAISSKAERAESQQRG